MRWLVLLVLIAAVSGCMDPQDRRPGLWLSGEVVEQPVEDWSFTRDHAEIFVETRTPYRVRHSVTIVCASIDGRLYIGARNPEEKQWVEWVARDPRVRLEIGDRIYPVRLERIQDPEKREAVYRAYAAKYDWGIAPPDQRPDVRYYRVTPRG